MKRKSKLLALLLSLVLCFSVFTAVTVFATENDEGVDTSASEPETAAPTPETASPTVAPETKAPTQPPTQKPTQAPTQAPTQKPTQAPAVTQAPETEAPETEAPETTAAPTYEETEATYNENNNNYNEEYYYETTEGYEERESNTTDEKAETAAVYDAENDDVSKDTLKKGDWAKIAAQLKGANGDNADDFAFIRNNDAGSGNNGEWMLILGILMEAAGIGIIVTMVVMNFKKKKALAGGGTHGGQGGARSRSNSKPRPQRSASANEGGRHMSKSKRSKFDTADVVIPKHAKESNPNRYKPRH